MAFTAIMEDAACRACGQLTGGRDEQGPICGPCFGNAVLRAREVRVLSEAPKRRGRKPLGDRPLTAAERSAARHARTRDRIAELEAELAAVRAQLGVVGAVRGHLAKVEAARTLADAKLAARAALGALVPGR